MTHKKKPAAKLSEHSSFCETCDRFKSLQALVQGTLVCSNFRFELKVKANSKPVSGRTDLRTNDALSLL